MCIVYLFSRLRSSEFTPTVLVQVEGQLIGQC